MAVYRKIYLRLWSDARFTSLSEDGQRLVFFLLTGPNTCSVPGLLGHVGPQGMWENLRWDPARFWAAADELGCEVIGDARAHPLSLSGRLPVSLPGSQAGSPPQRGPLRIDVEHRVVWFSWALEWTDPNPNALNVVKAWATSVGEVPDCPLKREAVSVLWSLVKDRKESWRKTFRMAFGEAYNEAYDKPSDKATQQKQKQYPPQEEHDRSGGGGGDLGRVTNGTTAPPPPGHPPSAPERPKAGPAPPSLAGELVGQVQEAFRKGSGLQGTVLDGRALAELGQALAEGLTVDQVCRALERGLPHNAWAMGKPMDARNPERDADRATDPPVAHPELILRPKQLRRLLETARHVEGKSEKKAEEARKQREQAAQKGQAPSLQVIEQLRSQGIDLSKIASG